jgi:hypothetical protein
MSLTTMEIAITVRDDLLRFFSEMKREKTPTIEYLARTIDAAGGSPITGPGGVSMIITPPPFKSPPPKKKRKKVQRRKQRKIDYDSELVNLDL